MRMLLASILLLAGLGFACGHANPDAPTTLALTGVTPRSGVTGDRIDLVVTGNGFGSGTTVMIGETRVTVTGPAATRLTGFVSSQTAGTFDVVVTNSDGDVARLSAAFSFVLAPAPVVTSLSVTSGITGGGEWLDVNGAFRPSPTVTIGGGVATMVNSSGHSLFVLIPPHAVGVADIVVTHQDGQSTTLANAFTYTPPWPGDFNGVWSGFGGVDDNVPLRFTIEHDRLTSMKCGAAAARTFETPPAVANGAFSVVEGGLEISGALISDTVAGGLIKQPACANTALGWQVYRD